MTTNHRFVPVLFLLLFFLSCVDTRKATNFNDLKDSEIEYKVEDLEPVIQKNDILSISVSSVNPEATQPFNLYTVSNSPGTVNAGTAAQSSGFLVAQDGTIQFP